MLLAGDEFARTQRGNNNAYCQDNEISWVDWDISPDGRALIAFVQRLIALRNRFPILRRARFLSGHFDAELGFKDVTWINPAGDEMQMEDWTHGDAACFGMLMDGRAQASGVRRPVTDATLLMLLNAHPDDRDFTLPDYANGRGWHCVVDTAAADPAPRQVFAAGEACPLAGRSLLVLASRE
jgi:glycogen operon protein